MLVCLERPLWFLAAPSSCAAQQDSVWLVGGRKSQTAPTKNIGVMDRLPMPKSQRSFAGQCVDSRKLAFLMLLSLMHHANHDILFMCSFAFLDVFGSFDFEDFYYQTSSRSRAHCFCRCVAAESFTTYLKQRLGRQRQHVAKTRILVGSSSPPNQQPS